MVKHRIFKVIGARDMNRVAKWIMGYVHSGLRRRATVLALKGDLGTGKTTFVKALSNVCRAQSRAVSPSFVLLRTYKSADNTKIHHIDAWRISSRDMGYLGFDAIVQDPRAIVCVEWADRVKSVMPRHAIWMNFQHVSINERKVTVKIFV